MTNYRPAHERKDSWISVEWSGDKKQTKPSAVHGVLDQITGRILGDHRLIQQGKREWRKASEYRRILRERNARRQGSGGKRPAKAGTSSARFWGSLIGARKRPETVKVIGSDGRVRTETRSRGHTSRAEQSSRPQPRTRTSDRDRTRTTERSRTTTDRTRRPRAVPNVRVQNVHPKRY